MYRIILSKPGATKQFQRGRAHPAAARSNLLPSIRRTQAAAEGRERQATTCKKHHSTESRKCRNERTLHDVPVIGSGNERAASNHRPVAPTAHKRQPGLQPGSRCTGRIPHSRSSPTGRLRQRKSSFARRFPCRPISRGHYEPVQNRHAFWPRGAPSPARCVVRPPFGSHGPAGSPPHHRHRKHPPIRSGPYHTTAIPTYSSIRQSDRVHSIRL